MEIKEKTKSEILEKLDKMSDFLKIDYLEKCIRERQDILIKKFCNMKLALFYLEKGMFSNAAKNMDAVARLSQTYEEKIKYYIDEAKILIGALNLRKAENIFNKALSFANKFRRIELKKEFENLLKEEAEKLEKEMKRAKALEIYEHLYKIGDEIDRKKYREKLLHYYMRLGKIKEYNRLKSM